MSFRRGSPVKTFHGWPIPPGPSPRWTPIRHALLYGVLGGALIVVLQLIEYRYLVRTRSFEIYGG